MPNDVHPQIRAVLDRTAELADPKLQSLNVAEARAGSYPSPVVADIGNSSTRADYNHVPVRFYRVARDAGAPVIVFYHGGGRVIGALAAMTRRRAFSPGLAVRHWCRWIIT